MKQFDDFSISVSQFKNNLRDRTLDVQCAKLRGKFVLEIK